MQALFAFGGDYKDEGGKEVNPKQIRDHLISAGVKNLKEFGYPECTSVNILTDEVYVSFFVAMLVENKGHGTSIDKVINELLQELQPEPLEVAKEKSGK